MSKRFIAGLVVMIFGFLLSLCSFFGGKDFFVFLIYGVPIFVIGLVIMFNKNEDKVEEIDYKGGKK